MGKPPEILDIIYKSHYKLNEFKLKRLLVLGLDGFPFSLIEERQRLRPDSIWHRLLKEGKLIRINSSRPEVSSVAWASYLTGRNPGEHGLFGFVDRSWNPFRLYFPNGAHIRRKTLPELVHESGGTVVSINVPTTYPPKPLRGLIIGGFLGLFLEKNVHPVIWIDRLRRLNYIIDVDPKFAYQDKNHFLKLLFQAVDARTKAAREAIHEFDWTLFQLHIMETDRLFHFFWDLPEFSEQFHKLLDKVDDAVEEFAAIAENKGAELVILSDHGFTKIRKICFINYYLQQHGYLAYTNPNHRGIDNISSVTRAYALPPGRIFLAVKGREPFGSIAAGQDYYRERDILMDLLNQLHDSGDSEKVFCEILPREEVYQGPYVDQAADILAFPQEGIDLKADFNSDRLFETPNVLVGTHTYNNAFFYVRRQPPSWKHDEYTIAEVGRFVADLLGVKNA